MAARQRARQIADAIADEKEFITRMTVEHRDRLRELELELVRWNKITVDTQAEMESLRYRAGKDHHQAR